LWRRRFGGDTNILNHEIALNGQSYTVVGIAPPGFYGVDRGIVSQFWVPLAVVDEIMPDLATSFAVSYRPFRDNSIDCRLDKPCRDPLLGAVPLAAVGHGV
jgi:hypothetical protein